MSKFTQYQSKIQYMSKYGIFIITFHPNFLVINLRSTSLKNSMYVKIRYFPNYLSSQLFSNKFTQYQSKNSKYVKIRYFPNLLSFQSFSNKIPHYQSKKPNVRQKSVFSYLHIIAVSV